MKNFISILVFFMAVFVCSGGWTSIASAGDYEPTGWWSYTTSNNWASEGCQVADDENGSLEIVRTGSTFYFIEDGQITTGGVIAEDGTMTIKLPECSYEEIGEINISVTLSSNSAGTGTGLWTMQLLESGVQCNGGFDFTLTRIGPEYVSISGNVNSEGTPLCAMVLAGGRHMFTCGDNTGQYEMVVPLETNGMVRLQAYCEGQVPFVRELTPAEAVGYTINMTPCSP